MSKLPNQLEYVPLDDQDNYWYSTDLGCCAALITRGYQLVSIDRQGGPRATFILKRGPGLAEAADDYWADRLEVKARRNFDNLRMLKGRLRAG